MDTYTITIIESSKELSARERIKMKDITNAVKFDEAINPGEKLQIKPADYAVLAVHNENSENKDYNYYIIVDQNGDKYMTGSQSFWESFKGIYDEMKGEDEEYAIEVYKVDSTKYKGKQFLACSIL